MVYRGSGDLDLHGDLADGSPDMNQKQNSKYGSNRSRSPPAGSLISTENRSRETVSEKEDFWDECLLGPQRA